MQGILFLNDSTNFELIDQPLIENLTEKLKYYSEKNGIKRETYNPSSGMTIINYCLENNIYDNMNVAISDNLTIDQIARIALRACNAEDIIISYDVSKPNGQHRKDVSIDLLKQKIPSFNPINLYDGIKQTYTYLIKNKML
jgi:nucleoside-diphosphate-sugar epimerase